MEIIFVFYPPRAAAATAFTVINVVMVYLIKEINTVVIIMKGAFERDICGHNQSPKL